MINITMKSKGSINQSSILSLNSTHTQSPFSAGNITSLNKPVTQRNPHTPSSVPRQAPVPAQAARQVSTPVPPARQASVPAQAARQTAVPAQSARQQAAPPQPARQPAAPPIPHRLPVLLKPVQKGQKAPLTAGSTSPGILKACFGWNTSNPQCDVDVSAFLLGADGRVPGDSWFVFYGQDTSPDKSCRFETSRAADREMITIDFRKLHPSVKKIVFVLTINEAFAKRLHFGMIKDAYIRILDERGRECTSFQMTEYYSNVISMMIGEIYQYNGIWKFNAVGNGAAKDLAGLCALYGVEVC